VRRAVFAALLALVLPAAAEAGDRYPDHSTVDGPAGMLGDRLTDESIDYITSGRMRYFADTSALTEEVWVDAFNGSDANSGAQNAPLRTLTAAAAATKPGTRLVLHAGTVFSPLTLSLTGTGRCTDGEAISWTGASTGVLEEFDESGNKMVVSVTSGVAPIVTDTITGGVSNCSKVVSAVVDTMGNALGNLYAGFNGDPEAFGIVVESSSPVERFRIHCNDTSPTTTSGFGAVIRACADAECEEDVTAGVIEGDAPGYDAVSLVGVIRGSIEDCDEDGLDTVGVGAKLVTLDTHIEGIQNVLAANNNCITSHNVSAIWDLDGGCLAHENQAGSTGPMFGGSHSSSTMILSDERWQRSTAGAATTPGIGIGKNTVVIGAIVDMAGEAGAAFDLAPDTTDSPNIDGGTATAILDRVVAANSTAATAAVRVRINGSVLTDPATRLNVKIFNSTIASSTDALLIDHSSPVTDEAANVYIRGLVMDGITDDNFNTPAAEDVTGTFLDVSQCAVDDTIAANDWRIGGVDSSTIDLAQAAVPADWQFFTMTPGSTDECNEFALQYNAWQSASAHTNVTKYQMVGAHAAGDRTIDLDTGTLSVSAGDKVTFAGDTTIYIVTVGITAPGIIGIMPGLTANLADNTEMTLIPMTRTDFACHSAQPACFNALTNHSYSYDFPEELWIPRAVLGRTARGVISEPRTRSIGR
jgi:hypothetical protein